MQLPIKEIVFCRLVNRQYRYIVDKLWYNLCRRDFYVEMEIISENTYFGVYKTIFSLKKLVKELYLFEPADLNALLNLEKFSCNNTQIKKFPTCLSVIKKLKVLSITNTFITHVPKASLINLRHLKDLCLTDNELTKVPKGLEKLNLKKLDLSHNSIKNVSRLWVLTTLKELNISDNHVKDLSNIQNLVNLRILRARYNDIEEIPDIKNLNKLNYIDMSYNYIREIPPYFYDLTTLETLFLASNYIQDNPEYIKFNFRLVIK